MLARSSLDFLVALIAAAECVQVSPIRYGRIEVQAFDLLDKRIPPISVDLFELGTRKSLKSEFRGAEAEHVPYGWYTMKVFAPGFGLGERSVRLDQAEMIVRVQLSVEGECGHALASLGGTINPTRADRELWVKAVEVHGTAGGEARVDPHGNFLIAGLDNGSYLLMVLDGPSVIHSETLLRVAGEKKIAINLGGR